MDKRKSLLSDIQLPSSEEKSAQRKCIQLGCSARKFLTSHGGERFLRSTDSGGG